MDTDAPRRRPSRRPRPQPDERTGWGVWLLVAACLLAGAGVLVFLRDRVVQTIGPEEAATPAAVATTPAAAPAAPPPGEQPPPPRGEGEGHVSLSPQEGLRVLWASPKRGTLVYPHEVLTVQFSSPMDPQSLRNALQITPPLPGTLEWPQRDHLVYRPSRPLELGTTYRVVLTGYAQNLSRQEYLQRHEWSFEVYKDYSFTHNVGGVLRHACGECHRPGGLAPRVLLDAYEQTLRYVRRGDAATSPLLTTLGDPRLHGQVRPESRQLLYVVRDWIDRFDAAE